MNRARVGTAVLVMAALLSAAATFGLSVFSDREGGVTVILLRRVPGWPTDTYGDDPHKIGTVLVLGNENGVIGEDLVRWNARYAVWVLGALAIGRVWLRARARRR